MPGLVGETDIRQPGEDKQAAGGCAQRHSFGSVEDKAWEGPGCGNSGEASRGVAVGGMLGEPLLSKRYIHKEGSAAPIRLGREGNAAGNAALARRPGGTAAATWEWGPEQEAFSAAGPGLAQAARMFRP